MTTEGKVRTNRAINDRKWRNILGKYVQLKRVEWKVVEQAIII